MRRAFLAALAAAVVVCAPAVAAGGTCGRAAGADAITIRVLGHGWHTGIVVRSGDAPVDLWPESRDFPGATWLEFGWGDRAFYQAREPTLGMALRAAFGSASVLHVVGGDDPLERVFAGAEIVDVALSREGLDALIRFIAGSVARGGAARVAAVAPGRYGRSAFYPARGTYSLLNTCNTWVGEALEAAGCRVNPSMATTAEGLLSQVRRLGASR